MMQCHTITHTSQLVPQQLLVIVGPKIPASSPGLNLPFQAGLFPYHLPRPEGATLCQALCLTQRGPMDAH